MICVAKIGEIFQKSMKICVSVLVLDSDGGGVSGGVGEDECGDCTDQGGGSTTGVKRMLAVGLVFWLCKPVFDRAVGFGYHCIAAPGF